jgi:F-type H+-transporting ATPase subunit b
VSGLGVNAYALASQVVVFLVLLFILGKWVFPAIVKTLDKRALVIREGVENAERARQDLAEAEKRVEALLDQARRDAQATLAKATQTAEQIRQEIRQQADAEAAQIRAQNAKRIEQEIAAAKAELSRQIADLAIMAAERVLGSSLDSQTNRRLIDDFVAQSRDLQC